MNFSFIDYLNESNDSTMKLFPIKGHTFVVIQIILLAFFYCLFKNNPQYWLSEDVSTEYALELKNEDKNEFDKAFHKGIRFFRD